MSPLYTKGGSANLVHMKIKFLLSILLGICLGPTHAATFIINPAQSSSLNVAFKVKKIDSDGLVTIASVQVLTDMKVSNLFTGLQIGSEYQFFYHQTPLSNALTIRVYISRFAPWKEKGVNLIAMPPSQVDFAMQYFPIEKKYRELNPLERYTYSSGVRICLQVEGYIRRVEKELNASVAKELKQLIALYTSIRCTPSYAPCLKRALHNPIHTKLLLTSAYKEYVGSLVFDFLVPFVRENKPCEGLVTLPEKAILFLYMHKDHFLDVKLLRWLTDTQRSPLRVTGIAQEYRSYYALKKSCIDSLLADGDIPVPLLKKVIAEAKRISAWDVLIGLACHGFLCTNGLPDMSMSVSEKKDNNFMNMTTYQLSKLESDKEVFSLFERQYLVIHARLSCTTSVSSLQKMCDLGAYTSPYVMKGTLLLCLGYLGAKYIAPKCLPKMYYWLSCLGVIKRKAK